MPTNFFLNEEGRKYIEKYCPIDNNYVQINGSCSGSYVNGAFGYYPVFGADACQCNVIEKTPEMELVPVLDAAG